MRNVFKKMILTAVLVFGTLVVLPATVEAKTKTLTYNINKVTADEFCKDVYAKGVTAHCLEKDKNKYKITITVKAKSEKDGVKKVESFAKKVMKAKSNKYGLSYGVSLKDDYNWYRYNNKKKVLTVKLFNTANDLYYLNCITRDALQTNWIESTKCSVKTKTVFPDSESFKKASGSCKPLRHVINIRSSIHLFSTITLKLVVINRFRSYLFTLYSTTLLYGFFSYFSLMLLYMTVQLPGLLVFCL